MQEKDWSELDARALAVLAAHDGVAPVAAFDAAGISRRQLGACRGRGVIDRPRIGRYVDPALPWQVKHAVRVGGIAACVTAAALRGLPVPPGSHRKLHVLVGAHDTRLRHNRDRRWVLRSVEDDPEVELHRCTAVDLQQSGRTGLVDTLLMLVACVPPEWFVAAMDSALHVPRGGRAMLSPSDLARLAALLPRRKRRLLDLVDPRAESCIETLLRLALRRRGVAEVVLQAVPHPAYRVDFLIAGRVVVEVDGAAYHDPEQDAVRDAALRALGYRVLRFSYDRVVFDIDAVLDEIEAELA